MQQHQQNGVLLLVAASLVSCVQITSTENDIRRQTRFSSNNGAHTSETLNMTASASSKKQHGNSPVAERSISNDLKVKGNIVKKSGNNNSNNNGLSALGKAINRVLNPFVRTTKKVKPNHSKKRKRSTTSRAKSGRAALRAEHNRQGSQSETTPLNKDVTEASIVGEKEDNLTKQVEYLKEEPPHYYDEEYVI